MQAQLAVVTGRCMLPDRRSDGHCACCTLLTLVVGYLNDRAIMRRIEQLERTEKRRTPETPVGPMVKPGSAGRTTSRLRTAIIFVAIILAGTAIGLLPPVSAEMPNGKKMMPGSFNKSRQASTPSADGRSVPKQTFVLPGLQLQMIWVGRAAFRWAVAMDHSTASQSRRSR